MRIGILTYYFVHNYGAILQAYGMQRVLEELGHDPAFLEFQRNYDHMPVGAEKKYNLSIKSIPMLTGYLLSNGVGTFYYNYIKRNKLHEFSRKHMRMGERYSDANRDAVLIGSDEVFSIDVGLNPFLYGHDVPVKNIFSYAASFGSTLQSDIKKTGCEGVIESGLKKLSNIGVRDVVSQRIVKELTNRDATITCDPVILYGYKSEIEAYRGKNPIDKYIIVYSYDRNFNDIDDVNTIKAFAEKHNLKIWSVGYYHKWCDRNIMCSPIEMLDYFLNAKMVITDTFHGSVVSVITNTPLMVRLAKRNQKVEYLLNQYDMDDRRTSEISDIERIYNSITDYSKVNAIVEEERKNSLNYLKKCLE